MKNALKSFPIPIKYVFALAFVLSIIIYLQILLPHLIWGEITESLWYQIGIPTFFNFLIWAILSPFIYLLLRYCSRFGIGVILILSVGIAFTHEWITTVVCLGAFKILGQIEIFERFWSSLTGSLTLGTVSSLLQLWVSIAIFYAAETQKKNVELEKALTDAQLSALQMQLHPHFLFNTLNTISALMIRSVTDAQNVIAQLADLLRTVLTESPTQTTTLQKELAFIQNYLSIEQIRFQDRLNIQYNIAPETETAQVPGLILQPIVENAIKHGFSQQIGSGTIVITSATINNQLTLTVQDDGAGLGSNNGSFGIGLKNVQDRLSNLYNGQASFVLQPSDTQGVKAILTIPFSTESP